MQVPKVMALFFAAGLFAAAVSLLLGFLWIPSLFCLAGVVLFMGLSCAYMVALSCGWVAAAPSRMRYWESAALIVLGYPVAVVFGSVMALFTEALLFVLPSHWHAIVQGYEPVPMIGLLSFWGSLAAALCVNAAIMVITDRWDGRLMAWLSAAGTLTTIVAMAIYAPHYATTTGFAAKYRELVLFGVLLPLGDVLYSLLVGYALLRAMPQPAARAAAVARA